MGTTSRIGVEEELHVVDVQTRRLVPRAPELLARLPSGSYAAELHQSVVETNSAVCSDLGDLREDLLRLRTRAAAEADALGLALVSAGTVPLVDAGRLALTDSERFAQMADEYQLLVREQLICGAQVHVDVPDRDTAVAVARRLAPQLPVLLALSASSPFWHGADTGYASTRSLLWQRWPTSGPLGEARTAAEYDAMLADLVASGTVSDTRMAYFDVRPSVHLATVELRLTDACPSVDDAVLLAGLFRALVRREQAALAAGEPERLPPTPLLRAAAWRASRSGLEADLLDLPRSPRPVPAPVAVRALVDGLRGWLEDTDDWKTVTGLVERVLRRGSSAAVQRRVLRRTGRLPDVVDDLARRTRGETAEPPLWGGYRAAGDEAVDPAGEVRPAYGPVLPVIDALGPAGLDRRAARRDALQREEGLTFRPTGSPVAHLFPVDLVPRLVAADDWRALAAGLVQRARALDAFLHDVYDRRQVVADGVLPAWVVDACPGLEPDAERLRGQRVRAHVSGMDVVRDASGAWAVLEDNLRVPSGIGYALATRRLVERVLPELVPPAEVLPVDGVPALLLRTLREAARDGVDDPQVVLLSDGPDDSAWHEHDLLARSMGVPAVVPAQVAADADGLLVLVDGHPLRVHVVYLRVGDQSLAASAGADGRPVGLTLMDVAARGQVALANAPGNGVADDKALYAFVPELIRYYLGESPLLAGVPTWLCRDPEQREDALARAAELVFKPVDGYGGHGVLVGPRATEQELAATVRQVRAEPGRWIAQQTVQLSTLPSYDAGQLRPRHVDLRAFVLLGREAVAAPAALTRVAPPGSLVVNSSRGGGAKATWLLA